MCATSSTSPAIANRRCQIAARSMPSNHSSTNGNELIKTSAAERSRIETAPTSCPTYAPVGSPEGRATTQSAAYPMTRLTIVIGPRFRDETTWRISMARR
jgi:hypothetical protein